MTCGVLFFRGGDDFVGRETDAVIDHAHAHVAGADGDLFGAVGMTVKTGLGDEEGEPAA